MVTPITPEHPLSQIELSKDDVIDYLSRHPDLLLDQPALLAKLELCHHAGEGTISLVERQVSILRERNIEMRHRLNQLLDNARRNDLLFSKARQLIIEMLAANTLIQLIDSLFQGFDSDFIIEQTQLFIFSGKPVYSTANASRVHFIERKALQQEIPSLSAKSKIFCGQLTDSEKQALFKGLETHVNSAAVVPLIVDQQHIGILAIGNEDADYYRSSMDTLFLSHIADVFSLRLAKSL